MLDQNPGLDPTILNELKSARFSLFIALFKAISFLTWVEGFGMQSFCQPLGHMLLIDLEQEKQVLIVMSFNNQWSKIKFLHDLGFGPLQAFVYWRESLEFLIKDQKKKKKRRFILCPSYIQWSDQMIYLHAHVHTLHILPCFNSRNILLCPVVRYFSDYFDVSLVVGVGWRRNIYSRG